MHDLIILGAGPAGMTAGVYAARKQLDVLIISENIGGQTTWSSEVENYLGFTYITGPDLVAKFEDHLRYFNLHIDYSRCTKLERVDGGFKIETDNLREFTSRCVIVATGKSPRMLDIPGEKEFRGKGVAYCSTCDAPLYAGMRVAVVGGGNSGADAVLQLMKITPQVYWIEVTDQIRADEVFREKIFAARNVEVMKNTVPVQICGDVMVTGMTVHDKTSGEKREIDLRGVFVEIGLSPNTEFLEGLIRLNKWGEIPVSCAAETGIPGLFAAGDVTDVPVKQIIVAAGDGAKAALGAYDYIARMPMSEQQRVKQAM